MPRRTLVLSGCGTLGITYSGALRALEEKGIQLREFEVVYGTSIGGLIGLLIVLGMSHAFIRSLLMTVPVSTFFRLRAQGILTMADTGGVDTGGGLRRLIRSVLRRVVGKETLTFGELAQRYPTRFAVNSVDIRSGKQVILGTQETPDIRIEDALCATAAIPGLYAPVHVNGMVLVDGAVWDSFLINHVPKDDLPLTITIVPLTISEQTEPTGIISVLRSAFTTLMMRSITQILEDELYKPHIIRIPTPVSSVTILSEEANSKSFRETLDFIGYTEVSRSDIINKFIEFAEQPANPSSAHVMPIQQSTPSQEQSQNVPPATHPATPQPAQTEQLPQLEQNEYQNIRRISPSSGPETNVSSSTNYVNNGIQHQGPPGSQATGMLPAAEETGSRSLDTTLLQRRDISVDSSRSLPPPIDTREQGGPSVAPLTYRPMV